MNRNADLTQEELRRIFDYNESTGEFVWKVTLSNAAPSGSNAGRVDIHGYRIVQIKGKKYKCHRLAWLYVHGYWPDVIDHINRIRSDNRISNLRLCNLSQNCANARVSKNSKCGIKGIFWHKASNKWAAEVAGTYLGVFESMDAAKAAYDTAAKNKYGEYAAT